MKIAKGLTKHRRAYPPIFKALFIVALCLVLVIFGSFWNNTLGRVSLIIASPFLRLGNSVISTFQNASSALRFKQSLLTENTKLKQRLLELEANLSDHQILEEDNRALRQEIGLTKKISNVVVSEIVSYPWNSPFDVIIASLPEGEEVVAGDQVIFGGNVLAGEVINQTGRLIKIKLVSAPDYSLPVLVGPNNIPALATGRGNGNLAVELPRNLEVKAGESVVTANLAVPMVIGTVGAIDKDQAESLQTVLIKTPINLAFVRYLEIHAR